MIRSPAVVLALALAGAAFAQEPASVFLNLCAKCHPPEAVVTARSRDQWSETINKMVGLGAKVSAEERGRMADSLTGQTQRMEGGSAPRRGGRRRRRRRGPSSPG